MNTTASRISRALARRPRVILACAAISTITAAALVPGVHIDSSMDTIFIDGDPELLRYESFKDEFGEDEIIVVALEAKDGDVFSDASLRAIDGVTRAIDALPRELGIDRVVSITKVDDVRPSEDGFDVGPLLAAVPADEAARRRAKTRALENPLYVRNLVSEDATAAAVTVFLDRRKGDRDFKEAVVHRIRTIVAAHADAIRPHLAGIPVLTVHFGEHLRRDLLTFIPLTVLVMALALWFALRSLIGVVFPLVTVGAALVWTIALVRLSGSSIAIVSSIIPPLLLTLGCAFGVHVVSAARRIGHDLGRTERTARVYDAVLAPVSLSGMTTVFGFATLAVNEVTQVREFGIFAAFGICACMVIATLAIPAALHFFPERATVERASNEPSVPWRFVAPIFFALASVSARAPKRVLAGAVVALVASVVGMATLTVDTDYASNFAKDSEAIVALEFVRERLAGERPIVVVLRAKDDAPNAALDPAFLAKAAKVESILRSHPLVKSTISITGYLENMNQAMMGGDRTAHVLPRSKELAAQYLELYGRPNETRRLVSEDGRSVVVFGRSSIISSEEFVAFMDRIRTELDAELADVAEFYVTGSMFLLSRSSLAIARGQAESLILASVMIFGSMIVLYRRRSLRFGLIAFVPNILPILFSFALMSLFGVTLNTGTAIVAGMALGIVDDDTIHFFHEYRRHRRSMGLEPAIRATLAHIGPPVFTTTVSNALGFLVLTLSSFAPLVALGWLTATTMFTALASDLLILPALLRLFDGAAAEDDVGEFSTQTSEGARG